MSLLKNKTNKRAIIIGEASKLFRERGFGGTSMRDLAEKVGIEAASIYNHIRSKDELLEDICFGMAQRYIDQLAQIELMDIGFSAKIESLIRFHLQLVIDDASAVSVVNNDWKYLNPEKMIAFKAIRNDYEKRFAQLITKGFEAGDFKPINVSVALFTILSSLRWVELWYKPSRDISKEELAKDISTILMNGLKAQ